MEDSDERLMELVEAALLRPASERAAWLRLECGTDTALAAEVMDRAAWEEKLAGFLSEPIIPKLPTRAAAFAPNTLLAGRYRMARELGRGRTSVVYEAFDVQTQQRIAVKTGGSAVSPPPHEVLPEILQRGEAATVEGPVAFVAMELLEGAPLADALRNSEIPADSRLAIALQLCAVLIHGRTAGLSPAACSARGVILTSRGPVLTEDWRAAREPQAEAADVLALVLIFRRLLKDDLRLKELQSRSFATLAELRQYLWKANGHSGPRKLLSAFRR